MFKVVCIDNSNALIIQGNGDIGKLLTIGKIYDAYTADDFKNTTHMGKQCPSDCYYIIADDGHPVLPLRKHFKVLRESNLDILLDE